MVRTIKGSYSTVREILFLKKGVPTKFYYYVGDDVCVLPTVILHVWMERFKLI